ncbi:RNA polymerase sigma factor [Sphingobacterium tabacisoli]|uniref:RNA polymerase sigma factor n=1 Tax=Sphingobacterium tabacisoli TaxID=2044855 RepID=A0ABW5L853_9SPHI|nr:sigma factor [Sphingobacterium tabacisoli]
MDLSEDEKWFIQLQQSNEIAFRNLYEKYSVRILKRFSRLLKDEKIAKQILQDVFLKIRDRHEMLDTEKSFRSYLFQIAKNREIVIFHKVMLDNDFMNHIIYLSTEVCRHAEQVVQFKKNNAIFEKALKIF